MGSNGDNYKLPNKGQAQGSNKQLPPFENPLIVDALAKQACQTATLDDIKNFRLVCKLWRDALPEEWKSGFDIHRISQQPIPEQVGAIEDDAITLAQLRDVADVNILSKGTIELQSWEMEDSHFQVQDQEQEPSLENWFWITFGSIMTSITFNDCEFLGPFTIFSETFLKGVTNLKILRVINCQISALGWEAMRKRFIKQREYFKHFNLKNVYLDLDASDEQFNHLWSSFQRSLPNLEHVSVKRLKRVHSSLNWAVPLLRYWDDTRTMKKLTFAESGESCDFQALYQFSISRSVQSDSMLKVVWHVSRPPHVSEKLLAFPSLPYIRPKIRELHLSGQVFPNLCFLTAFKYLRLLVWTNDEGLDNYDEKNVKTPFDIITSYFCIFKHQYPKLEDIYIQDTIIIDSCNCEPEVWF